MIVSKHQNRPIGFVSFVAALVAIVWIGAFVLINIEEEETLNFYKGEADRLSQLYEVHTNQVFNYADAYVKAARNEYLESYSVNDIAEFMEEIPLDNSMVSHITLVNADGNPIFLSGHKIKPGSSAKDRTYFKYQKRQASDNLYISRPQKGRNSGKVTIRLVRPIFHRNGEFKGVIFAAIEDRRLVNFFDLVNMGDNKVATIIGMDRFVRARSNYGDAGLKQDLSGSVVWSMIEDAPSGSFTHHSLVDGIERSFHYHRMTQYPLVVVLGISLSDIAKFSDKFRIAAYIIASLLSVGLIGASIYMRREIKLLEVVSRNEKRFIDFAESTSDWFWEMDEELRFTYFTGRNMEVTGQDPSAFIGKKRTDLTSELLQDHKWQKHYADLEAHRPFRDFHYSLKKPNNEQVEIIISGKPLFDENGKFKGYSGTGADYSKQFAVEQERNSALQKAEQANRIKSDFLANMSHELRTPLNAIIGYSTAMLSGVVGNVTDKKDKEYLKNIQTSGEFLLELINDVLDISKIEAGEVDVETKELDLSKTVNKSLSMITDRAARGKLVLHNRVGNDLPPVFCDERHLQQILLNLLSNAVKFTPEQGSVTVIGNVDNDQHVYLEIKDTGIGIDKNKISEIMMPFGQVAGVMTRNHEGTGLGLTIAKSLSDLNQIEFDIQSDVGVGVTVRLTFNGK